VFLCTGAIKAEEAPRLSANKDVATEGYITLSWQAAQSEEGFVVQLSEDPQFQDSARQLAVARQNQVHISGLSDGLYFAQLLNGSGEIIAGPIEFEVRHRNLADALWLFGTGLALFLTLLLVLLWVSRAAQQSVSDKA